MASFYFEVNEDISPEEYLSACGDREIIDLIDQIKLSYPHLLEQDGSIISSSEELFLEKIRKISINYHRLSLEDEEVINKIYNKL